MDKGFCVSSERMDPRKTSLIIEAHPHQLPPIAGYSIILNKYLPIQYHDSKSAYSIDLDGHCGCLPTYAHCHMFKRSSTLINGGLLGPIALPQGGFISSRFWSHKARFPSRSFYNGTLSNGPDTLLRQKIDGWEPQMSLAIKRSNGI